MFEEEKRHSPACERNKDPIYQQLRQFLPQDCEVLEIGSGTGQHASYFAQQSPGWKWQPADQESYLSSVRAWTADLKNVFEPIVFKIYPTQDWVSTLESKTYDAVYTANTLHIMDWESGKHFLKNIHRVLSSNGHFFVYGPFKISDRYVSASDEEFDRKLQSESSEMGYRRIEDVIEICESQHLVFDKIIDMPANNKFLHFQKRMDKN